MTKSMNLQIPQPILNIYKTLEDANFQVYLVGGSVRNMLLEKEVKDWDMTTSATPEDILKLFPQGFYDNQFGTVGVPTDTIQDSGFKIQERDTSEAGISEKINKTVVEITTFRTERDYKDSRHPSEVAWGKSIEEDLERRDFTINAIAMKLTLFSPLLSGDGQSEVKSPTKPHPNLLLKGEGDQGIKFILIDPYNGQRDLENKIIRAVGDPTKRFKEDALRLMRAVRFATQLSFTIEEYTWKAMQEDAVLLEHISSERIHDELIKTLASNFPYEGIMLLKNAELLKYIIPELLEGIGISQERPGRHHTTDVFTHNVLALKFCPSENPVVRFSTLIHDVGKPRVEGKDEDGLVIFYNHEVKGARLAYEICERLKLSKK